MALARTALGTYNYFDDELGDINDHTLASQTLATGDLVIVGLAAPHVYGAPASVKWGSEDLSAIDSADNVSGHFAALYYKVIASGGTHDIVVHYGGGGASNVAFYATKVTGNHASPLDVYAHATGNSGSPSSGTTATTAVADEFLVGIIAQVTNSLSPSGSWSGSFSAGQNVGTGDSILIEEGYRIVSSTGTYSAAKTGATSLQWADVIATFKSASTPQTTSPSAVDGVGAALAGGLLIGVLAVAGIGAASSATATSNAISVSAVAGTGAVPTVSLTVSVEAVDGAGAASGTNIVTWGTPVEGVGEVPEATWLQGAYDPVTPTVQGVDLIGGTPDMKIRPTDPAELGDQELNSGFGISHIIGPGSGTTTLSGTEFSSVEGNSGVIDYIVIQGDIWIDDTVPAGKTYVPHNVQFWLKIEDEDGNTYGNVEGVVPAAADGRSHWVSDHITDRPGGGPWTWDDMAAIEELGVQGTYVMGTSSQYTVLSLQEVWIEVFGPQGVAFPPIAVPARVGSIIINAAIDPSLGG